MTAALVASRALPAIKLVSKAVWRDAPKALLRIRNGFQAFWSVLRGVPLVSTAKAKPFVTPRVLGKAGTAIRADAAQAGKQAWGAANQRTATAARDVATWLRDRWKTTTLSVAPFLWPKRPTT